MSQDSREKVWCEEPDPGAGGGGGGGRGGEGEKREKGYVESRTK